MTMQKESEQEVLEAVGSSNIGRPTIQGRKNAIGNIDSLCWYCKRAYGSCSWSSNFVPVAGWDAKPSKYSSYRVYGCPKFIRG